MSYALGSTPLLREGRDDASKRDTPSHARACYTRLLEVYLAPITGRPAFDRSIVLLLESR